MPCLEHLGYFMGILLSNPCVEGLSLGRYNFFFIRECFGQRKIDPIKFIKGIVYYLSSQGKKEILYSVGKRKIYSWPKQLFFHLCHQTLCFHVIEPNCWHLFLVFPLQMGPDSVKLRCLSETIQLG